MSNRFISTIAVAVVATIIATPSLAQWTGADISKTPTAGQNYVVLGGTSEADSSTCYAPTGFCVNNNGINLNDFSRAADVATQFAAVNAQLNAISTQNAKLFDQTAISTSMRDAIPNAGDRFAVRLNMGGFSGHIAGSIGASANLDDSIRFSANYGQGHSQSAFSAGLNFSFH